MQLHQIDLAIASLTGLAALIYFRDDALHAFAWLAVRFGGN